MTRRGTVVRVTDHAVLRWLQRRRGFDIEAVRREVAAEVEGRATPDTESVVVGQHRLMLVNHGETRDGVPVICVTTVLDRNMGRRR